jgi:formylglycine-generating enzyme required for sulfatase activity
LHHHAESVCLSAHLGNLVTQGDYLALMGVNPSHFTAAVVVNDPVYSTNQPVESVSWFDATSYCDMLTRQEIAAQRIPAGSRFRLPTEAEWEYACRADTSTRYSFGDNDSDLSPRGWFNGNNNKPPRAVGLLLANPFGLYDMHGNVFEWCQDWYGIYPGGEIIDPQGPPTGTSRVARGGAFNSAAWVCRSARRGKLDPATGFQIAGFRVVLAAAEP